MNNNTMNKKIEFLRFPLQGMVGLSATSLLFLLSPLVSASTPTQFIAQEMGDQVTENNSVEAPKTEQELIKTEQELTEIVSEQDTQNTILSQNDKITENTDLVLTETKQELIENEEELIETVSETDTKNTDLTQNTTNIITKTESTENTEELIEIKEESTETQSQLDAKNINSAQESGNQNKIVTPKQEGPVIILTPQAGEFLTGISSSVMVKSPFGTSVDLLINGKLVDFNLIGRIEEDEENDSLIQTWYGVIFREGKNTLTARTFVNGQQVESTIEVMAPGIPTKVELTTDEARIPADGRSSATVRGRFVDKNGGTSKWNTTVTLFTSSGEFVGADAQPDIAGFQVESINGEFNVKLKSSLEAQKIRISAIAGGGEYQGFTTMVFSTELRDDPIFTGFIDFRLGGRGSNYYDVYKNFLPLDGDNSFKLDVSSNVFATGSLGEWKYTAAYTSENPFNPDCSNCDTRQSGNSNTGLATFNNAGSGQNMAPTNDQVYLRLERSSHIKDAGFDYFMWGDYSTEEFTSPSQQFSSISRQLHGAKFNYNFGNLQLSGLYANQVDGFQRDTLAANGTTGTYFLSRRLVKSGSEEIFIELENLYEPGKVISRQRLNRNTDYDIDYDRGSLTFRDPILRTETDQEGNVLIRQIVVTYEYQGQENDNSIIGGRIRYHFNRNPELETWLGATYWNEDRQQQDFILYGLDTQISLGKNLTFRGEYAHSENHLEFQGFVTGEAYKFDLDARLNDQISAKAFYQTTSEGFSNNATLSFVPGQTRYGAEVSAQVGRDTTLRVRYDHDDNFGVAPRPLDEIQEFLNPLTDAIPGSQLDNSSTTISAGLQQRWGKANFSFDWVNRSREDRMLPNALTSNSSQLRSKVDYNLTDNLTLRALNEVTLSSSQDSVFGDRTAVGLDWKINDLITLGLEQQWFTSGQLSGKSVTRATLGSEYSLGSDTKVKGRYAIENSDSGFLGRGALGLEQGWTIASGLRMKFAYEHIFTNDFSNTTAGKQNQQPFAFGQSASALQLNNGNSYSVGLDYTDNPDFNFAILWEHNDSATSKNTVLTANATGNINEQLKATFNYRQSDSANSGFQDLGPSRDLKLGLGYQTLDRQLITLFQYQFRQNPSTIPESILLGKGSGSEDHLFSLEALYNPSWRWELYGKYAFRNSSTYMADDFTANSSIHLTQLRAAYRLNYQWELVGEGRLIRQPTAGYTETGLLVETGYYLTPELRLAVGYSFGSVDDADFSGTRSAGGPYLGLTVKLNGLGGFAKQKPVPAQQQELQNPDYANNNASNNQEAETLERQDSEIEKTEKEEDTLSNQNIEELNSDNSFGNYFLAKEQRENSENISLVDELIRKYSEAKIASFTDILGTNYDVLTEEQAQNWRIKL